MLKNERGITLVALVITIIVLIILATVSISLALNPNSSVIGGAEAAKDYAENDMLNWQSDLTSLETRVNKLYEDGHIS